MKNIICKLFGHKVVDLNTTRGFAHCDRCCKALKVSYDTMYGETIVMGDYGNQKTFVWCNCGNELCSSKSFISDTKEHGVEYKCSKCGEQQWYDFDCPAPYKITDKIICTTKF